MTPLGAPYLVFTEGGIILLRDVSTTDGGMTPSEGGIKAAEGDNIFTEGGIMSSKGGIVNSESDRSQDTFGGQHFSF